MDSPRMVKLQPPFWVLGEERNPGFGWTHLNETTTFWFTSSQKANLFLLRKSEENSLIRTKVKFLPTWADVFPAMWHLMNENRPYMLMDPETTDERRLWTRNILKQLWKEKKPTPTGMEPVEVEDKLLFDLDIYCDESGTPPTKDGDDILIVSALVARGGRVSGLRTGKYEDVDYAANKLTNNGIMHASFMVKPGKGYGAALEKKMRDYRFAADLNAEYGRPNLVFNSSIQLKEREYVWVVAIQAVVSYLIRMVAKQENIFVESTRIFMNQFRLMPQMRSFFRQLLKKDGPQSDLDVLKAKIKNPLTPQKEREQAIRWGDKFRLKHADDITAVFDFERPIVWDEGFLALADRLAHYTFVQLRNDQPKPVFFNALKALGKTPEHPLNVTENVIDHRPETFDRWEREMDEKLPTQTPSPEA